MKTIYLLNKKIALAILISGALSADAQLKLYSTGSLSIGSITQPPANTELQVIGNTLFSKTTGVVSSSAYVRGLNIFSTDSLPDYSWYMDTLTGIFHPALSIVAFTNIGRETMRLTPANNILMGSSSDNGDRLQVTAGLNTNPLDIYSNFNVSGGYSGVNWLNDTNTKAWTVKYNSLDKFYVYGNGQAYSYGWNTMSDSTLKENVHEIQNALNKVLKLQGVTYNLKQSSETANGFNQILTNTSSGKMGLIAQAVERVAPEVVTTTGDGLKTVAYGNLVGLLIEAIKQEDAKVSSLQNTLDSCIAKNTLHKKTSENTSSNIYQAKLYPCKACPLSKTNAIHCYIPSGSKDASLMVFDINGMLKKSIPINGREEQYVSFKNKKLSAGLYYYSLVIDGEEIDIQKIILTE